MELKKLELLKTLPELYRQDNHVPDHVAIASSVSELKKIHNEHINLSLFPRELPEELTQYIETLNPGTLPHIGFESDAEHSTEQVTNILNTTLPGDGEGKELFIKDICFLIETYFELMWCQKAVVRMHTVQEDLSDKFHADFVGVRLLCTYRGPSTQWLPNGIISPNHHMNIEIDPAYVGSLPKYSIGLFKGRAYEGNARKAIIHRSPPLKEGEFRFVLWLDSCQS